MKPITLFPHELNRLLDTGSVTVWRPVNRRSCASVPTWLWNRLEWDDAKVPTGAMGTCADNGYLHIACRPVEGDSPDEWTRERVYPAHPPGSERWVREVWAYGECECQAAPAELRGGCRYCGGTGRTPTQYKVDHPDEQWGWRSPVTMPRWASRLAVVSKAVQARQVQSITEKECWESGVYRIGPELETPLPVMACEEPQVKEGMAFGYQENPFISYAGKPRVAFIFLWDGRYNPRGYCPEDAPQGWDANPWAWATTLERKG